jgi:hypothetical protein
LVQLRLECNAIGYSVSERVGREDWVVKNQCLALATEEVDLARLAQSLIARRLTVAVRFRFVKVSERTYGSGPKGRGRGKHPHGIGLWRPAELTQQFSSCTPLFGIERVNNPLRIGTESRDGLDPDLNAREIVIHNGGEVPHSDFVLGFRCCSDDGLTIGAVRHGVD